VRVLREEHHEYWLAAGVFTALTLVLTYPLSIHPGSTSLGSDPDVHTFTWTLAWDAHALVTAPWSIFDANIFYPYDRTLAFSENLIGSAIFSAPLWWLTGNAVLAMNAAALLSVVLCGLGAYVLARQIGLSKGAALVAGLVFAFSPARFFRFQQLHLTAIQWMPFTLAFLHAYFRAGRRRDLRLAMAFFALQALSSLHGAVYLAIAVAIFVTYRVTTGTPIDGVRGSRSDGPGSVLLLVPLVALAVPYLRVQRELGLVRTLENWIPAPESFVASPTHLHSWMLSILGDSSINERASAFLFPGYLPLALVAVAVLSLRERGFRHEVVLYAVIALAGLLLSAGPPLSLWPYVYWLPGLNFIRIPSRFFLLAMLGVAVLAAIGYHRGVQRLSAAAQRVAAAATAMVLIAEFSMVPLPVTPYRVELPDADRWLDTQPKPFAVAEVPVGPAARYHSTYMLHSMAHWQRTVHGHSSLLPALHERLYDQLRGFPDEASIRALDDIGVDFVVVHIDMYRPGEWTDVEYRLGQYAARLVPLYADATGRVYRLQ
jgi:hypothetical protein